MFMLFLLPEAHNELCDSVTFRVRCKNVSPLYSILMIELLF